MLVDLEARSKLTLLINYFHNIFIKLIYTFQHMSENYQQRIDDETPSQSADDETSNLSPHKSALLTYLQVLFDLQFIKGEAGLAWADSFIQANGHRYPNPTSEQQIHTAKASMLIKLLRANGNRFPISLVDSNIEVPESEIASDVWNLGRAKRKRELAIQDLAFVVGNIADLYGKEDYEDNIIRVMNERDIIIADSVKTITDGNIPQIYDLIVKIQLIYRARESASLRKFFDNETL